MMEHESVDVEDGGPSVAAVLEMLRAVTHKMSPSERLAAVRFIREGMNLVPPDTDERLLARMNEARSVPVQVIESVATALEPSIVWQQSANTTPEELRSLRNDEHRSLFEELGIFAKVLGFNLKRQHYDAVLKARIAVRAGRNLGGPEGLAAQAQLDAVAPLLRRNSRKRPKPEPPAEVKK